MSRKAILVVHLLVNAGWLGALLCMGALVLIARPFADRAAFVLNDVAVWTSLLVLATSLCFANFTPWGFLRFKWVTLKWIALALLSLEGVFLRTPALNALAAHADVHSTAGPRAGAIAWVAAECAALALVFLLSVAKPWGRIARVLEPSPVLKVAIGVVALVLAAFASAQSAYLSHLRATAIAAVDLPRVADGEHTGEAIVGVRVAVRARVAHGRLVDVVVTDGPTGHYAMLARGVSAKMVRAQRIDVDGVSGATTTSRAIQKAVEVALTK